MIVIFEFIILKVFFIIPSQFSFFNISNNFFSYFIRYRQFVKRGCEKIISYFFTAPFLPLIVDIQIIITKSRCHLLQSNIQYNQSYVPQCKVFHLTEHRSDLTQRQAAGLSQSKLLNQVLSRTKTIDEDNITTKITYSFSKIFIVFFIS